MREDLRRNTRGGANHRNLEPGGALAGAEEDNVARLPQVARQGAIGSAEAQGHGETVGEMER